MYSADLTSALPPKIVRFPRCLPLSRLMGARPARAADPLLVELPELRKPRQEGAGADRAYSLEGLQEIFLFPP